MTQIDFTGDYLTVENTKENAIVKIVGEGAYVDNMDKTKKIFNLPVECEGKKRIYSPFDKEGIILQRAFGDDTKTWVGKSFKALHMNYQGFGGVAKKKIVPEVTK